MHPEGGLLGQKVGPLPLVAWVGLAGGAVAIGLAVRSKMKNSGTAGAPVVGISGGDAGGAGPDTQGMQNSLTDILAKLSTIGDVQKKNELAQIWITNQMAWASSENAALLSNPNMPNADAIRKDMADRMAQAFAVWKAIGGDANPPFLAGITSPPADGGASTGSTATPVGGSSIGSLAVGSVGSFTRPSGAGFSTTPADPTPQLLAMQT